MGLELISFDCADTLLRNRYHPIDFALSNSKLAGLPLPPNASELYGQLLMKWEAELLLMNLKRSLDEWERMWVEIVKEWVNVLNGSPESIDSLWIITKTSLLSAQSSVFQPFEDTLPALEQLKSEGIRMSVISNWDVTLIPILEAHKLDHFFDDIAASLCEGVEKPNPKIFEKAHSRLKVEPHRTIHVGDSVTDDFEGATNARIHSVLIDRSNKSTIKPKVHTLLEIPTAIQWYF